MKEVTTVKIICSLRTLVMLLSTAFVIGILAGVTVSRLPDPPPTSDVLDHRMALGLV